MLNTIFGIVFGAANRIFQAFDSFMTWIFG